MAFQDTALTLSSRLLSVKLATILLIPIGSEERQTIPVQLNTALMESTYTNRHTGANRGECVSRALQGQVPSKQMSDRSQG